jgi:hypothetical protein
MLRRFAAAGSLLVALAFVTVRMASAQTLCQWVQVEARNPPPVDSLYGAFALSSRDVWAVGANNYYWMTGALAEHWSGTKWSVAPAPSVSGTLYAVSGSATNDVWAVGTTDPYVNGSLLIAHWDGATWRTVSAPTLPSQNYAALTGVTAISSSDVWAVGYVQPLNSQGFQALAVHWDGTKWSLAQVTNAGRFNLFYGVAATGPKDVWAVGGGSLNGLLIEHWDGAAWSLIPNYGTPSGGWYSGVAAISPTDAWAVGRYVDNVRHAFSTLTEHWDGRTWRVVASPNVGENNSQLLSVSAASPTSVWAVGYNRVDYPTPLVLRWDGNAWIVVADARMPVPHALDAVAADPGSGDVWAVGTRTPKVWRQLRAFTERYACAADGSR